MTAVFPQGFPEQLGVEKVGIILEANKNRFIGAAPIEKTHPHAHHNGKQPKYREQYVKRGDVGIGDPIAFDFFPETFTGCFPTIS